MLEYVSYTYFIGIHEKYILKSLPTLSHKCEGIKEKMKAPTFYL